MVEASAITAVLGPTNTGKTHRAVTRMLEHESGIIGLPLRLLAREVYDRVTARVGEASVALVTGEEKRVPKRPSYWVCTVESMPVDREVDFVAVDEVQLAAHAQRGHVFTDRLLHARGKKETYFLGSDTIRSVLVDLVPTARVERHPRLSTLRSAPAQKLAKLPPRSAVVGFSMQQVVELGERLRALRGGAAVVMGALSPRTRNAQVAMFQAGEVDCLVATDAIGMGLNLDVDHVAFAALRKFDGKEVRELDAAELGQIAGRAGRHLRDGTFGALAPLSIPPDLEARLVGHRFDSIRRVRYRSSDLDFRSIEALGASLREPPRRSSLLLDTSSEDLAALEAFGRDDEVRSLARGVEAVALLWDVCKVPDFRKLLFESHFALLREVFVQLTGPSAVLDEDWVAETVASIDDTTGDLDTLMARIAAIRTWTYISNQSHWVRDAGLWQARTRAVEDRLSDAMHERLVQRFVDRRIGKKQVRERKPPKVRVNGKSVPPPGAAHPFAGLASLRVADSPKSPTGEGALVERVVASSHEAFDVDARGVISVGLDDGERRTVGRIVRGASPLLPEVRVEDHELGAGARSRLQRRLVAWARDAVNELLEPLRRPEVHGLSAPGRGVVYQLERGLGTAPARDAFAQLAELSEVDRDLLASIGVEIGRAVIFVPRLLEARALARRALLVRTAFGDRAPPLPQPGTRSFRVGRFDPFGCLAIGYPVFAERAIRVDVAERVAAALPLDESEATVAAARWLGCPPLEVDSIAAALASWHESGRAIGPESPALGPPE